EGDGDPRLPTLEDEIIVSEIGDRRVVWRVCDEAVGDLGVAQRHKFEHPARPEYPGIRQIGPALEDLRNLLLRIEGRRQQQLLGLRVLPVEAVVSAFAPVDRRRFGYPAVRSGVLQDAERYRGSAHVLPAPRCRRNTLAHARPATQEVSELVVT